MLYIRTDANETIAAGHVMRCLSIAKEAVRQGMQVEFLVSDEASTRLLEGTNIPFRILHTDWRNLDSDEEIIRMESILKNHSVKPILLVDSYSVDNGYFLKLRNWTKLVMIDDLFSGTYDVDIVINYAICYKLFDYAYAYEGKHVRLLLGPQYTPLREQFRALEKEHFELTDIEGPLHILMMCGGGDPLYVLLDILEHGSTNGLMGRDMYHVVAGAYHPSIDLLKDYGQKHPNVRIYQNVTDMAELMQKCDIAVSAAGTTLYECCAVGLPTVFFCMADNQQYDGLCFSRDGLMLYAGDFRFQREECIHNIFSYIAYLRENAATRQAMGENLRTLVDGNGVKRIIEEIGQFEPENEDLLRW